MLYRKVYLEKDRTMPDAGEYTVDVTPLDPITMLWVRFQATNGATSNRVNTIPQCINAIELIDGADVVYSLDGPEAIAQCAYDAKRLGHSLYNEANGEPQSGVFPLMFGRYLGDKELSFDTTRFTNPQLRVNWNLAKVRAVGADGFVTGSLQMSVIPVIMVGAPKPRGVLCSKQIYTYTTSAGGTEYIDLPTDEPYRRLVLRGVKEASAWHWGYDIVKLSFDGGKFVPFDMRGWDIVQGQAEHYPIFHYHHRLRVAHGNTVQAVLRHEEVISGGPTELDEVVAKYAAASVGEGPMTILLNTVPAGLGNMDYDVQGWNPFDCVSIPFGDPDVIDDWLPTPTFRSARLEVRAGVADAANAIVLQTLRTY